MSRSSGALTLIVAFGARLCLLCVEIRVQSIGWNNLRRLKINRPNFSIERNFASIQFVYSFQGLFLFFSMIIIFLAIFRCSLARQTEKSRSKRWSKSSSKSKLKSKPKAKAFKWTLCLNCPILLWQLQSFNRDFMFPIVEIIFLLMMFHGKTSDQWQNNYGQVSSKCAFFLRTNRLDLLLPQV